MIKILSRRKNIKLELYIKKNTVKSYVFIRKKLYDMCYLSRNLFVYMLFLFCIKIYRK